MDFLRYLLGPIELPAPALAQDSQPNSQTRLTMFGDANSHGGYFLAEAVRLGAEPLVDLLLAHGADPLRQAGMAISLAITKKDESLVRKLVSKCDNEILHGSIGRALLAFAVQKNARAMVDILLKKQQIQPDANTLELLNGWVDYQM
ncbi:hypothetical protein FRC04_002624 [Tulasnella sp. 424]|nr:hypothetical protein FRC04_002624 [Tulasnella sp. 424]KAG8981263.1 hypothetical protein FRC05_004165 [Tulasnella sp. 425]